MNYIIENNYDWKSQLYSNNQIYDSSHCLISFQPLTTGFITLPCNHSFNYESIVNEIFKQKKQFSSLEITRLNNNQIKCPFCRTIYDNLLPYYNINNISKVKGVNCPEKFSFKFYECQHIYKNGKQKNLQCKNNAFISNIGCYCNKHYNTYYLTDNSLSNDVEFNKYKVLRIPQLKNILRVNNCKVGGNKTSLIERILYKKKEKCDHWIEI